MESKDWPFRVIVDNDYRKVVLSPIFDALRRQADDQGFSIGYLGDYTKDNKQVYVLVAHPDEGLTAPGCDQIKGLLSAALARTNSTARSIECQDGTVCQFTVSGLKLGVF